MFVTLIEIKEFSYYKYFIFVVRKFCWIKGSRKADYVSANEACFFAIKKKDIDRKACCNFVRVGDKNL